VYANRGLRRGKRLHSIISYGHFFHHSGLEHLLVQCTYIHESGGKKRTFGSKMHFLIVDLVTFHSNKYLTVEGVKIGSGI